MMYSFDEIGLVPTRLSTIKSRKQVNPFDKNGKLPLFVAPMTCILNAKNYDAYNKVVYPVYPIYKNDTTIKDDGFVAVTLNEFKTLIANKLERKQLCIDTANGHMKEIYDLVPKYKDLFPESEVMIGNIANPETYLDCCKAGIDYVRVGIGGGAGCTTSAKTAFHCSLPYLLTQINKHRSEVKASLVLYRTVTKVIADGGIDRVDKIIKALALGADYVMMGKLFAECREVKIGRKLKNTILYYGQASVQGQKDRFGEVKNEPEGTSTTLTIKYSLASLLAQIEAVLRSAMSYAGASSLYDFIGKVAWEVQSVNEFKSFYKE